MKTCCRCKIEKTEMEFNKKSISVDGLERYCKDCHREKNRLHYARTKEKYIASAKRYKQNLKNWFKELKGSLKCEMCGETKPWRLTFHHSNPLEKETEISSMVQNHCSKKRILQEINKCQVLCHNCHSDVHYEQFFIASRSG